MNKRLVALIVVAVLMLSMASVAFAVGTVPPGLDTGLTAIKDDAMASIAAIAPIAIGIFGAFFLWKLGKKFFGSVAKG